MEHGILSTKFIYLQTRNVSDAQRKGPLCCIQKMETDDNAYQDLQKRR
jgi:hypothetical protein